MKNECIARVEWYCGAGRFCQARCAFYRQAADRRSLACMWLGTDERCENRAAWEEKKGVQIMKCEKCGGMMMILGIDDGGETLTYHWRCYECKHEQTSEAKAKYNTTDEVMG